MPKREGILRYIEEIILLIIITIDIFGWVGLLPPDMEFIDKLISWLLMGYLFYRASVTRILFGIRHRWLDFALIASCFLLIFKNLIVLAEALGEERIHLTAFFDWFAIHGNQLEVTAFVLGGTFLILISLYAAGRVQIRKPSVMNIIHEDGAPRMRFRSLLARFIKIHLAITAFFVVVFNLIMEWLAMVEDDIITILSIVLVVMIMIKYRRGGNIIFRIPEVADSFYEKAIRQLQSKTRAMLTISGLLVLHLLTDAATFITPFIFWKREVEYFGSLGAGHEMVWRLLMEDMARAAGGFSKAVTAYVYSFNVIGILLLMLAPAAIWYIIYAAKKGRVPRWLFALFFMSVSCFLLAPVFRIGVIKESLTERVIGVDILTQNAALNAYMGLGAVAVTSVVLGILIFASLGRFRKPLLIFSLIATALFFGNYIYNYMTAITSYYLHAIPMLVADYRFLIAFYFLLFFVLNILFYLFGTAFFIYEAIKELK